jgi:F-type H+-transporting ATPase subunit delta
MPSGASAKRYARAVFEIARENGEIEGWLDDLGVLVREVDNADIAAYLDAPQVSIERKTELVKGAFGDAVGPLAVNLLLVLASRGNASLIRGIAEEYQQIVDADRGIERAEVVSAVQLDRQQLDDISSLLKTVSGKEVTVADRVEPDILGGLIVRVGDRVMDGSTRTRLQKMRKSLA